MVDSTEIRLPFPPSANALYKNKAGARGRAKTPAYETWICEAGNALIRQRPHRFLSPVRIDVELGLPNRRLRDIDNTLKPIKDLLVRHGVIQDDSFKFVTALSVRLADIEPGVIVTVTRETSPQPSLRTPTSQTPPRAGEEHGDISG